MQQYSPFNSDRGVDLDELDLPRAVAVRRNELFSALQDCGLCSDFEPLR